MCKERGDREMQNMGAVVFLPREDGRFNLMLEELMFAPGAVWLRQALEEAGFTRFLVVCHEEERQAAQGCFPQDTVFVTNGAQDAREQLVTFLSSLEGRAAVITRPVYLNGDAARALAGEEPLPRGEACGVFRADAALLKAELDGEEDFNAVLARCAEPFGQPYGQFLGVQPLSRGMEWESAQRFAKADGITRLNRELTSGRGVVVVDPSNTYVGPQVTVGDGTVLLPGTILRGCTAIGRNCQIGPNTMIRDCTIGDGVTVNASQLNESTVEEGATVGPFAYIRPHCHVGANVKVGDFVELKNSNIGAGTKISHLTYVGDSDVGSKVNFGCGTVTVNYDGTSKFRTTIGDNAFIGCNTNLVAPVKVGEGAYTAAGSTITDEVPADSLAIARSVQVVKKQWAAKRRNRRK